MSKEPVYCKDCIKAKPKTDRTALWFCGKHRRFITEHSLATLNYETQCKDYEKR